MNSAPFQPIPFVAASVEEAVSQIRSRLGSDAVVLNVRPLRANGIARLWQKPLIEVLACRPEPPAPAPVASPVVEAIAEFRQELEEIRQQFEFTGENSRVASLLEKTGVQSKFVQSILDEVKAAHGDNTPSNLAEELGWVRGYLANKWKAASPIAEKSLHVFVGPAGSGKTTSLCKWLTQVALVESRFARVWRLDGTVANTAEALSVYCEILNVPSERSWQSSGDALIEDLGFIDLPGIDWRNSLAIKDLARQLQEYQGARVHLVLNAAYDITILQAQARAFSILPVDGLILTHLDEEVRWGKLWNLLLDSNLPLRFISTGQNIPGDFIPANPEIILSRQFQRKS